jgi:hypothetical protein
MIEVAIMESAWRGYVTASILATTHGLKPRLSSMMIGFEDSLFLLSHWLFWYFVLNFIKLILLSFFYVSIFQSRKIVSNQH